MLWGMRAFCLTNENWERRASGGHEQELMDDGRDLIKVKSLLVEMEGIVVGL